MLSMTVRRSTMHVVCHAAVDAGKHRISRFRFYWQQEYCLKCRPTVLLSVNCVVCGAICVATFDEIQNFFVSENE